MSAEKILSAIYNYWAMLLACVICVLLIVRYIKEKRAPVKSVKAVVAEKYKFNDNPKFPSSERYTVVFSTGKDRLSFYVSEFSYAGYKPGEKGTLKYKGSRLIGFKR